VETRGKIKKPIFPPFPTSLKNSPRNAASFSQFPQLLRLLEEKKGKTTKLVLTFLGLLMEATLSVFCEAWAFGNAAQLKNHASRRLPLAAHAQRGS